MEPPNGPDRKITDVILWGAALIERAIDEVLYIAEESEDIFRALSKDLFLNTLFFNFRKKRIASSNG